VVWRLSLNELNDGAAQTPNVRGRCSSRELDDLGRHPIRRTDDTRLVQPRLLRSDTKVSQFDESLLCCQDVGTLDVPVDDTLLVQVEEPMKCLGHVESDEVFWELAEVLADAVQRPIFAVPVNISPLLHGGGSQKPGKRRGLLTRE
jgi:hypothetical protein